MNTLPGFPGSKRPAPQLPVGALLFEHIKMNDSSKIAYCGLFCGDCIIRNGKLYALSQELLSRIRTPEFEKLAEGLPKLNPDQFKDLRNHQFCHGFLSAMAQLDCEKTCKDGGGSTACKIRKCCQKKGLDGCWLCDEFENCEILSWLEPLHRKANLQNMEIICDKGMDLFLKGPKFW